MAVDLVDRNWGDALRAGLARDRAEFRVVCPFITQRALAGLLDHRRPEGLRVVTRANLADFADGVSEIGALRAVLDAGGKVRAVRGLHAKVFVFGTTRAAVTSANVTTRGLAGNHEFGCISEEPAFVDASAAYFETMWAAAGPDITRLQLNRWDALVAEHLRGGARPAGAALLPDLGTAVPTAPPPTPADTVLPGWPAESGNAFVKFFGEGDNRADRTATAVGEVERAGCHWACTYPLGKRPRAVRDGDTIFIARLAQKPHDTVIFGRAIGLEHHDGDDDAAPDEIALRPFKARWPHYIRVHHGEFIAGTLANGVSLNDLMEELGPDAFASTQANAVAGIGNTNPRKALRQQAHVRLAPQGAAWVSARLEQAFRIHGMIPAAELDRLDWPAPR